MMMTMQGERESCGQGGEGSVHWMCFHCEKPTSSLDVKDGMSKEKKKVWYANAENQGSDEGEFFGWEINSHGHPPGRRLILAQFIIR
jgi:hypothetical protein